MGCDSADVWKELGQLKCKKCRFVTSEQCLMQAHSCRNSGADKSYKPFVKYKASSDIFTCSLCSFQAVEHDFVQHLQGHLLPWPFKCDSCEQRFPSVDSMENHIRVRHPLGNGSFSLTVSGKTRQILNSAKKSGKEFFDAHPQSISAPLMAELLSSDSTENASINSVHRHVDTSQLVTIHPKQIILITTSVNSCSSENGLSYSHLKSTSKTPSTVSTSTTPSTVSTSKTISTVSTSKTISTVSTSKTISTVSTSKTPIVSNVLSTKMCCPISSSLNQQPKAYDPFFMSQSSQIITRIPPLPSSYVSPTKPSSSPICFRQDGNLEHVNASTNQRREYVSKASQVISSTPLSRACSSQSSNIMSVHHNYNAAIPHLQMSGMAPQNNLNPHPISTAAPPLLARLPLQAVSNSSHVISASSSHHPLQHLPLTITQHTNVTIAPNAYGVTSKSLPPQAIMNSSSKFLENSNSQQTGRIVVPPHQPGFATSPLLASPVGSVRHIQNGFPFFPPYQVSNASVRYQPMQAVSSQGFAVHSMPNEISGYDHFSSTLQNYSVPIQRQFIRPPPPVYCCPTNSVPASSFQTPVFQTASSKACVVGTFAQESVLQKELNSSEKENFSCNQAQSMESSMQCTSSEKESVSHTQPQIMDSSQPVQLSKKTAQDCVPDLNSNYFTNSHELNLDVEDEMFNEYVSHNFPVVNKTGMCLRHAKRFSNVQLFYEHIHDDVHIEFRSACPFESSSNCPLLTRAIRKVDERSLGQLEQMELTPDKTNELCVPKDTPNSYSEKPTTIIKVENVSNYHSGLVKEECCDESTSAERRRRSCESYVKEEVLTTAVKTVRSRSLDSLALARNGLESVCSSDITGTQYQSSESEFESIEDDLVKFSNVLSSQMSKEFYKCSYENCGFCTHQSSSFLLHMEGNHGRNDEFYCIYCGFMGVKVTDLVHHFALHNSSESRRYSGSIIINGCLVEPVSCFQHRMNDMLLALERLRKEHEEKDISAQFSYQCDICESRFSSVDMLKTHLETSSLKTYGCRECPSVFLDSTTFEAHFSDVHPGQSRLRRVIVNFLCKFRREHYETFRKVLRQYVAQSTVEEPLPPYSPISEASNPGSPATSPSPLHLEISNSLLPAPDNFAAVPDSATECLPHLPTDTISTSSKSIARPVGCLNSPISPPSSDHGPLAVDMLKLSAVSSVSKADQNLAGTTSKLTIHTRLVPPASQDKTSVPDAQLESSTAMSTSETNLSCNQLGSIVTSTIDPDSSDLPADKIALGNDTVFAAVSSTSSIDPVPWLVSHAAAISVVSHPTIPTCSKDAATAPTSIDSMDCEIESAKHIDSVDMTSSLSLQNVATENPCSCKSLSGGPFCSQLCGDSATVGQSSASTVTRLLFEKSNCDAETKRRQDDDTVSLEKPVYYKCKFCDYKCEWDPEHMKEHLRNSSKHLFYKCFYCGNPYYDQRILKNHIWYHHGNKPFQYREFGIEHAFNPVVEPQVETCSDVPKPQRDVQIMVSNINNHNVFREDQGGLEIDKSCVETIDPHSAVPGYLANSVRPTCAGKRVTLKKFACKACRLEFSSLYRVELHYKSKHKGTRMKWIDKNTQFTYSSSGKLLIGKDVLESPTERYLCNLCGYRGETRSSVYRHQDQKHDHESSNANVIKLYGFTAFIKDSLSTSSDGRPTMFPDSSLENAVQADLKNRKDPLHFNCHLCSASMSSEFFLRIHLAKHKGFRYTTTLSTQDGLLICSHCNYVAHSNTDLANHVTTHVTDRRYTCSLCQMESHRKQDVVLHIDKRHKEDTSAQLLDREKRKGKTMKLKVVNLSPVVSLKKLRSHPY